MGDKVWWYEDCPNCGKKGGIENFEQLTSNMKYESCESCGYTVPHIVDDTDDIITITHGTPYISKPKSKKSGK